MNDIVDLLEEKNKCLEKFYRLNEAELMNFSSGNFDNLESFYSSREGILDMVKRVDKMIDDSNQVPTDVESVNDNSKREILHLLDQKNNLVTKILSQDLQVLSFIEMEKSNIIKELQQVKTSKKAMSSYKSGEVKYNYDEKA